MENSGVGQHGRNVRISVFFWECVTYSGVGTLVPLSGNINAEKYILIKIYYGQSLQNILETLH